MLANSTDRTGQPGDWWLDRGAWYPFDALGEIDRTVTYGVMRLVRLQLGSERAALSFDLAETEARSLEDALAFLAQLSPGPELFELSYCKTAWARECFPNLAAMAARVDRLLTTRDVEIPPLVNIRPRRPRDYRGLEPVMRQALAAWKADPDRQAWQHLPAGRRALAIHPEGDDLVFDYAGPESECARIRGQSWRESAVGTSFNAVFADDHYNARTSESCWRALGGREPIVEDIVAFVALESHDVWLPYQRALLPSAAGLTVVTKVTTDTPLPLLDQA